MSNYIPSIKKNKLSQKKSKSQTKQIKNPDIITQAKPLYLNNLILPFNPHASSLTPTNICSNLLDNKEPILPPKEKEFQDKKTLILDLDETLVHSSFTPFEKNDIILEVDFEGVMFNIYVLVRPYAKEFLINVSKYYEVIIFTASISKYASPLLDILDTGKIIKHRLYREQCTFLNGIYIKDLKRLNRPLGDLIIVDNSPLAYIFNEENGLPIKTWYDDRDDIELIKILPLLIFFSKVNDVRKYIINFVEDNDIKYTEANEFIDQNEKKKTKINPKEEKNNKENNDNAKNNENSKFNDYKIITSNIKKNLLGKFSFNNILNNKTGSKLNDSSKIILNKSENDKKEIKLVPIDNIIPTKPKNTSINNSKDDKNDFQNDREKKLKLGNLLRKKSSKIKNLFRLNNKPIESLMNNKSNKINNENNKNNQKNLFINYNNNLKNLNLPYSNMTKNLLFPKSNYNNNNNFIINLTPINKGKHLIEINSKVKYTNLLEKIEKKSKNSFTIRNQDNKKINFSNSNNNELIPLEKKSNLNKNKYLQIAKSNSINNILKFNHFGNNINLNNKIAKTPNKHLYNIFSKEKGSKSIFSFNKGTDKSNRLYKLIKGIEYNIIIGEKNIANSANPSSIRSHSKNSKK